MISGALGDRRDVRCVNHDWMFIRLYIDKIEIGEFSVTHVDGSGEHWIVNLPSTTWK